MHDEDFPPSAIDQERNTPVADVAASPLQPARIVADLLPQSADATVAEPIGAEQVARQTPHVPGEIPSLNAPRIERNDLPKDLPRRAMVSSALASIPQPAQSNDVSRSIAQQIDTTIRVQRELKIEIEDDVEQLAQQTSEYLATRLDQRDAQLLERIAQQINQHPTRQATLSGPGTSVGS